MYLEDWLLEWMTERNMSTDQEISVLFHQDMMHGLLEMNLP